MNIIQGYTRPLLQPIFFCGGRGMFLLEAGWMCVTWSANMFKPTNVQQNSHLGVRTTEIGSPQKKETVLDDFKATKNFNDKMCDYISCNTPCRITLSVPTQAKPWKVCGPRPPNGADTCRDPNQRPWPAVNHMNWRQVMVSWSNVQRFGEWKKICLSFKTVACSEVHTIYNFQDPILVWGFPCLRRCRHILGMLIWIL